MFQVLHVYIHYLASKEIKYLKTLRIIYYDENPVYVAPVQNRAGIHFMVDLSDHEVQCHNNENSY